MAAAHTALTATDPVADSTVNAGPSRVTATFNEPLQPTFASMTQWSDRTATCGHWGDATATGATAAGVGLRPLGPAGRYTVNYRVTSQDGHVGPGHGRSPSRYPAPERPDRLSRLATTMAGFRCGHTSLAPVC